ncbi:MAG: redox-regulated ATPase YchF [Aminobacterium sp.]|jgi:GTP-binding protein YchF|uniref:redox-regulated ATPase YchF n=1 Tax=unclassified Aminobacterium TaxID=2685012 RepID=UPI001BCF0572|nr:MULTISPECIES: redox-regulated ATPase YchF [unclassified Aminobacterium]MDD2207125.1 redox-regulated ATPase YchF [Aminobacterium sp.]MDD3427198.1 redox-regulated ATPase YchF [Aminobacterium sp.]MDD3707713.1 redox-regulated ATPase YchF [Aminobacterium sp.]MDD4228994.1 redox-regulated ATPase YchF [Aminobacterium sp.]MDD4551637.1 redox-regulated ATPase YchF [Aminobacterium sp.]
MLKCGIVGLPLCGKSTIFNVITRAGAEVKAYASGKTDPNRAMVAVPDVRFDNLVKVFEPKKEAPATVDFVDLAGLSKDASKGAGVGNAFLSFVSESDALVHVVRTFDNADVPHPEETIDPARDWNIVEMELIYRDLGVIENRLSRLAAKKRLMPEEEEERKQLERCQAFLMDEKPLRELGLTEEEQRKLSGFAFLTLKPEMIVLNLDETQTGENIPGLDEIRSIAKERGLGLVQVFGRMEMDMADLSEEEQQEFMAELGIEEAGRNRLIQEAYSLLGLISFFTTGKDEVKAWTLKKGSTAVDAAGAIHSDLARGFIRAQVVHYQDFIDFGCSLSACRDKGVLRLEGKDYIVQDGDMIEIRFNV